MNEIYYGMTYLPGEMKGILYQLLTSVSRQLSGRQGRSAGRLEPALQWLERHFYEETSIRELAALCCMSESWLPPPVYRICRRFPRQIPSAAPHGSGQAPDGRGAYRRGGDRRRRGH